MEYILEFLFVYLLKTHSATISFHTPTDTHRRYTILTTRVFLLHLRYIHTTLLTIHT